MVFNQEEVIAGCKQNNRICQEILYKKYFPVMLLLVKRFTTDQDFIIDIINNGFLKVFQKIDSYQNIGSFEGWLKKIFYHAALDYIKQNKKYINNIVFEEKDINDKENILSNMNFEQLLELVEELPSASKQVFNLYVFDGYSHQEIANELKISEGTSKWHLSNSRKILQNLLKVVYQTQNYERSR